MQRDDNEYERLVPFNREFFSGIEQFTRIGTGSIGGKAHGLLRIKHDLGDRRKQVQ